MQVWTDAKTLVAVEGSRTTPLKGYNAVPTPDPAMVVQPSSITLEVSQGAVKKMAPRKAKCVKVVSKTGATLPRALVQRVRVAANGHWASKARKERKWHALNSAAVCLFCSSEVSFDVAHSTL